MRRRTTLVAVATLPLLLLGGALQQHASRGADLFAQVFSLVSSKAVDTISTDAIYEKAARGLVEQLGDPYAELMSPEELARFSREAVAGKYGGLGMLIEDHGGRTIIARVFPNSPAERGGVFEGDEIFAVNGDTVRGESLTAVSGRLLGTPGSSVEVTFVRPGVDQPIVGRFTRQLVHMPAVPFATTLDGKIGYLPLQVFSETSSQEVRQALARLIREGDRGLVLDMRGNGGGSVDQAIRIASLFLPEGSLVASVETRDSEPEVYRTEDQPVAPTLPMIVLLDGGSASATEIVSGALQDHDRAVILGSTSFGKGLVQTLYPLDGGWSLKLTTGKWLTPSGRSIQKPRKLLPDGELVEIKPDSIHPDTAARPVYHSDAGRAVYGGGAITPDVAVAPDTITTAEQQFLREIGPKSQAAYSTIFDYALQLKSQVKPDFTMQPAWRDTLYARLNSAGVKVDRKSFDAASPMLDRMLTARIAHAAFGDSIAFRRNIDTDAQLEAALRLLREGRSQKDIFRLAERSAVAKAQAGPAGR
ncbi:MAG TPA: S41 family peptidase [Gemmatimonadales bacterium]|nr:S41 family peptidase [Gemmatimonadales bacterium]